MALDDLQMPSFKDPDGTTYIWDSASKSYIKAPLTDKRPDQSHATGGDNDLFDPFQHTEMSGSPLTEGYMAHTADWEEEGLPPGDVFPPQDCEYEFEGYDTDGTPWYHCKTHDELAPSPDAPCAGYVEKPYIPDNQPGNTTFPEGWKKAAIDEPPFPADDEVKCPNCGESTTEPACPACQKDLTPEWNVHGQENEFMGVHPEFNDAKEWRTWPQNVPKKNEFNYDDSFPSMSLSKTAEALPADDGWEDVFSGQAPMRTEVGKWILDIHSQMHIEHGMQADHGRIEQRDGLDPSQEIALGSVYNDGTADVQKVAQPDMLNLDEAQGLLEQAFGAVVLQPPVSMNYQQAEQIFPPTDIQGGQWFIPPHTGTITGTAYVKERPENSTYLPHMILCAEHLRPEDFALWSNGAAAVITAVGGGGSHAAYLAMTNNIPVIVGLGQSYNKLQTGNYLKIEPTSETITVMPGATSEMPSEQKHQIWNDILDYQRQRGGSVSKPFYLTSYHEEVLANSPNLEECPECRAPMFDREGEAQCGDCGHKQPIIHSAGAAALAVPELLGAGEAAGGAGAAGGGMGGIGSLMNGALGRGMAFQTGKDLVGGGHGGAPAGGSGSAPAPVPFDPNAGTVASQKFAAWNMQHTAVLSEIWALIQNALKGINWQGVGGALAANPVDDALVAGLSGGLGAAHQNTMNQLQQATAALGDDNVGLATKNDGTNSTDEASNSGIEGKKEQGDGPEQLKDVDGGHDSQGPSDEDGMGQQGDPHMQEKALKAFHMNLPLVIEFANSEEPGAENPILMALDAMLEEAFPGYKDGHEEGGAESEHPLDSPEKGADSESESPEERDEDVDEPDPKSEGSDKKEAMRLASVWHFAMPGEPSAWAVRDSIEAPTMWGQQQPQFEYQQPPAKVQGDPEGWQGGAPTPYSCMNCGEEHMWPSNVNPRDLPACPQCGAQNWTRSGVQQTYATLDPNQQQMGMGVPAGAGGPTMQICPRCGQAHTAGSSCPVADVTTPLTEGEPTGGIPSTHVVTKWRLAMPSNMPAAQPAVDAGAHAAPATTCPQCGCNHIPGTPCPSYNQNQVQAPGASGPVQAPMSPGVAYSSVEDDDRGDYHSEDDWTDESGAPLQEGAEYEMKTAHSPIGTRVTIEHILPEKLTYLIHSGDVDYRDKITRDQLEMDGAIFSPVDEAGDDSMGDAFPGEEMPVRPGQDALPQQDDLSVPSTVMSAVEGIPVSLDNYTGSYEGDAPVDRSWLLEDSAPVEVDPALMAKMAGKNYSPREQREFIDERGEARNLDRLDLSGTHYIDDELGTADSLW